jgi:hypothetical protein
MKIRRTNPLNSIRQEAVLQMVLSAPPVFRREAEFPLWRSIVSIPQSKDFNAFIEEMRSPTPQKSCGEH